MAKLAPPRRDSKAKAAEPGPEVFDYLDHRAFLRDYYVAKKASRGLSFRGFSRRAGLRSPNYLKLVIDGERNLTQTMAVRFAKAAALEGDAVEYFTELVRFGQARTSTEKQHAYEKLTGFRRYREARPLEVADAAYHSTWYMPAIRELCARHDFKTDPHWVASLIWPRISPAEAKRGIETLLELGLLAPDENGRIVQKDALVSTGPEVRSIHIANYHRMMMQRASEAIDGVPPNERDISSLTLCLGADGLRRLKERIQRFRRELLELSTLEEGPNQVVQLNFQLFPLSREDK